MRRGDQQVRLVRSSPILRGRRPVQRFKTAPDLASTPKDSKPVRLGSFRNRCLWELAEKAQTAVDDDCSQPDSAAGEQAGQAGDFGKQTRRNQFEDLRVDRERGGALAAFIVEFASKPLLAPVALSVPAPFRREHLVAPRVLPPPAAEGLFRFGAKEPVSALPPPSPLSIPSAAAVHSLRWPP